MQRSSGDGDNVDLDATASVSDDPASLLQRVKDLEAEVASLKQQLQAKDRELDAARKGLLKQSTEITREHPDMKTLQDRLTQLKREQSEANQTRDTAWKHLRETVQDLAKLVNQNDLNPLQTSVTGPVWKKADADATPSTS